MVLIISFAVLLVSNTILKLFGTMSMYLQHGSLSAAIMTKVSINEVAESKEEEKKKKTIQ